MAYVKKAFARLNRLGVKILCFGSGGARRVPEGFPKEEAFKQLVDFGKRIAPEARAQGITVVIEPLRRQETNIINTAGEGLALVKAVNDPNFELLIDFYHLASEKEDPAIILTPGTTSAICTWPTRRVACSRSPGKSSTTRRFSPTCAR